MRSDIYNVVSTKTKRLLKERTKEHTYRNLNGVEVETKHEAEIQSDGKGVLRSSEPEKTNNPN